MGHVCQGRKATVAGAEQKGPGRAFAPAKVSGHLGQKWGYPNPLRQPGSETGEPSAMKQQPAPHTSHQVLSSGAGHHLQTANVPGSHSRLTTGTRLTQTNFQNSRARGPWPVAGWILHQGLAQQQLLYLSFTNCETELWAQDGLDSQCSYTCRFSVSCPRAEGAGKRESEWRVHARMQARRKVGSPETTPGNRADLGSGAWPSCPGPWSLSTSAVQGKAFP